MKIKLDIQPRYTELEIHICNDCNNQLVKDTYATIKDIFDTGVIGYYDGEVIPLNSRDIIRIYAENQKVYAATASGEYRLHERLYELEEKLLGNKFLRISNSEIVNLKKIERLDTSVTGTVKMYLQKDMQTYVSRRYVTKIKKALGI